MKSIVLPPFAVLLGCVAALASAAASLETWRHDDTEGDAYICVPKGAPPFPAVVLNHGIYIDQRGLGAAKRRGYDPEALCETLAMDGYLAFLPIRRSGGSNLKAHFREVMAALGAVRARPDVDRGRVTLAGHSRGGLLSLVAAVRGAPVRSYLLLAPASGGRGILTQLLGAVGRIDTPLLVMVERSDKFSEVKDTVDRLEEALRATDAPYKVIRYDRGGGHDLFLAPGYYWSDMLSFLRDPPGAAGAKGPAPGGPETARQSRPRPTPDRMIQVMDADGDGAIAESEFKGRDRPFSDFDRNGDGVATREELEAALAAAGPRDQ
ncbi:MAG: dienelactone hydrolase family protein [Kiloniellaceae bacterium]